MKEKSKRVVVTGLGIITSIGETISSFEKSLFAGTCGIGPISLFDTQGFSTQTAIDGNARRAGTRTTTRFSLCLANS